MLKTEKNVDKVIEKLRAQKTKCVAQCIHILKVEDPDKDDIVRACSNTDGEGFCKVYAWPVKKWLGKDCTMADEFLKAKAVEEAKAKINPLKASKRASSGN